MQSFPIALEYALLKPSSGTIDYMHGGGASNRLKGHFLSRPIRFRLDSNDNHTFSLFIDIDRIRVIPKEKNK